MSELYVHQILVRTEEGAREAVRRLRDHGFDPELGDRDHVYRAIRWTDTARDVDVDFLRPDILPPRLTDGKKTYEPDPKPVKKPKKKPK